MSEQITEVVVPDIGSSDVDVIEIPVAVGDRVEVEATIITLESDKATIEVPSPMAGEIKEIKVAVGDKVSEGDLIFLMASAEGAAPVESSAPETSSSTTVSEEAVVEAVPTPKEVEAPTPKPADVPSAPAKQQSHTLNANKSIHAGPAVRRLGSELGVDLAHVSGSGPKGRILKEDVHAFVKQAMLGGVSGASGSQSGALQMALPDIDFSKWGDVEQVALTKIQRSSAANLHRSWVTIPHVTQFDEADITEMNAFRKAEGARLKGEGIKLTPLAFIIKAVAHALTQFPKFRSSLAKDGQSLIYKNYCHIGFAVDTPNGLVVPVLRDADQRSIAEIAVELQKLSIKARDKKLTPQDMQGGCFTISSLGGIGGTQFTPIVNWPEVAILGVSKAKEAPVYEDGAWVPRLIMPVSLSYDHRVIDGADAVRFTTYLTQLLGDIRRILL